MIRIKIETNLKNAKNVINLSKFSSDQSTNYNTGRIQFPFSTTFRSNKKTAFFKEQFLAQKEEQNNKQFQVQNQKFLKNKLYDLNQTLKLNFSIILDFIDTLTYSPQRKEKLKQKVKLIQEEIKTKESLKKEKDNLKSKNLLNMQIIEEIKSRKDSTVSIYKEKFDDLKILSNKKIISIKKYQKKFNEVQIYVRRECQCTPFKNLFVNFEIIPFILDNENMKRYKVKINKKLEEKTGLFNILKDENEDIRRKNEQNKHKILSGNNNKSHIKALKTAEKFDNMIKLYNEKINYSEKYKKKLERVIYKLTYELSGAKVKEQDFVLNSSAELNAVQINNITIQDLLGEDKINVTNTNINNNKTILNDRTLINGEFSVNVSYMDNNKKDNLGWDVSQIIKVGD